ncbi:Uncharacterised protein [Mycobacteroides abscessus subsp. abscessus]|nr:Uncharacterised protein [Mycobacteroides abscessus subsp. abscessus]
MATGQVVQPAGSGSVRGRIRDVASDLPVAFGDEQPLAVAAAAGSLPDHEVEFFDVPSFGTQPGPIDLLQFSWRVGDIDFTHDSSFTTGARDVLTDLSQRLALFREIGQADRVGAAELVDGEAAGREQCRVLFSHLHRDHIAARDNFFEEPVE